MTRLVGPVGGPGLLGTPGFAYSDFDKEGPSSGARAEASSIIWSLGALSNIRWRAREAYLPPP